MVKVAKSSLTIWAESWRWKQVIKIFGGELIIRTPPTTLLQIFCKIFLNSHVLNIIDQHGNFWMTSYTLIGSPFCCWLLIWPIQNDAKKNTKNHRNLGTLVLIWGCSVRAIQWIPTWQGSDGFLKSLLYYSLDKRSLSYPMNTNMTGVRWFSKIFALLFFGQK